MSCFDLTHAPVATTARAAATGPVSMSTRPDPEGSDEARQISPPSPAEGAPPQNEKNYQVYDTACNNPLYC